jgi:hypothetical protein
VETLDRGFICRCVERSVRRGEHARMPAGRYGIENTWHILLGTVSEDQVDFIHGGELLGLRLGITAGNDNKGVRRRPSRPPHRIATASVASARHRA